MGVLKILLIVITILMIIGWLVHIIMVKDGSTLYGWASYKIFVREFNKYNWDNEDFGGHSLWDRENNCRYHADIVYFKGIGMIMRTPIDWLLMHLFVIKYCRDKNIKQRYNWYNA